MLRLSPLFSWAAAALALGALLATCAPPPDSGETGPSLHYDAEETGELLPGTWLREYAQDGVRVRRLLTLDADGDFHEAARVTDAGGHVTEFVHGGTWSWDGTNLKRRYVAADERPRAARHVPLATFEIAFETRNAFVGVDHVHARTIRYERVAPQTSL